MKVSESIPGFYNGISQQPAAIRLTTQCEIQENALSSLVRGLVKRPNTELITQLSSTSIESCFIHLIDRDSTEQYIVIFLPDEDEPIEVYTLKDGTKCTVRYGTLDDSLTFTENADIKSYAVVDSPAYEIKACTIADYTIVVNTTVTVLLAEDLTTGTINKSVQAFADLPTTTDSPGPYTDEIIAVAGNNTSDFTGYYVKYDGEVWREIPKPGIKYKFSEYTAPHRLVRTALNEFTFAPIIWDERGSGDEDTCPSPSFIGQTIQNVTFYRNRLGFLSGGNIIFSKAGSFFDFWITTATDTLDDDPIDTAASSKRVPKVLNCEVFNKSLLIFSDREQYVLDTGNNLLTPDTASLTPTTVFDYLKTSNPVSAGSTCYFISPRVKDDADTSNAYVAVREYYVDPSSLTDDAADVTSHVPNLIPHGIIDVVSCNSMNMILIKSSKDLNTLFAYSYYWQGQDKVQSSWSKWIFDGEIMTVQSLGNSLYFVLKYSDGIYLERMRLEYITHGNLDFRVHLDRLVSVTGVYTNSYTTWTLPYEANSVVVVDPDSGFEVLSTEMPTSSTVKVFGDYSSKAYLVGINYLEKFRLSRWYIRNNSKAAIIDGKLTYTNLQLTLNNTGYFQLITKSDRRDARYQTFNPKTIGSAVVGKMPLYTGVKRFFLRGQANDTYIELQNDTYLPCEIQTGAFEGIYVNSNKVL